MVRTMLVMENAMVSSRAMLLDPRRDGGGGGRSKNRGGGGGSGGGNEADNTDPRVTHEK